MLDTLALYIHWPFCKSKCPYCDFNSHVRESIDEAAWEKALLTELNYWAERAPNRTLVSIFFGGGTPSLMPPRITGKLIETATRHWGTVPEITLEANPTSVEAAKLRDFKSAGINRLSMGIQSLHDTALKSLGREHSAAEALKALEIAQSIFTRTSFDLIYARTGQTIEEWCTELGAALKLNPTHLSLYQLTIEPGTNFAARNVQIPPESEAADMFELTQEITAAAGLPAYEISNHARPGFECRHNLAYWRYEDYVGIGPGAHGRVTLDGIKHATRTHRAPEIWLERVMKDQNALTDLTPLSQEEQASERLLMGLRLAEGLPREAITAPPEKIAALASHDLLINTGDRIIATAKGRLCLNALIAELDA